MTSFVSSLLYRSADTLDNLPFIGSSSSSRKFKDDSHVPYSRIQTHNLPSPSLSSDLIHADPYRSHAAATVVFDTPPPYDRYTQIVDKLIDSQPVNRKDILQGVKLVEIAVDEYDSGNEAIALDIYLSGLDKIIMAVPNLKYCKTKEALKEKLLSLENRVGIASKLSPNQQQGQNTAITAVNTTGSDKIQLLNDSSGNLLVKFGTLLAPTWVLSILNHKQQTEEQQQRQVICHHDSIESSGGDALLRFKRLGRAMTDIIVQCVVAFKQSPLPGLLRILFTYFLQLILWLDHQFQIKDKIQSFSITCIKKLLMADEKYHLHEFASEATYIFMSAFLKVIIAYKEAPSYLVESRSVNDTTNTTSTTTATMDKSTAWIWSKSLSSAMTL